MSRIQYEKKKRNFDLEIQGQSQFCARFFSCISISNQKCRIQLCKFSSKFSIPLCTLAHVSLANKKSILEWK